MRDGIPPRFALARDGYDRVAVDQHIEELERELVSQGRPPFEAPLRARIVDRLVALQESIGHAETARLGRKFRLDYVLRGPEERDWPDTIGKALKLEPRAEIDGVLRKSKTIGPGGKSILEDQYVDINTMLMSKKARLAELQQQAAIAQYFPTARAEFGASSRSKRPMPAWMRPIYPQSPYQVFGRDYQSRMPHRP